MKSVSGAKKFGDCWDKGPKCAREGSAERMGGKVPDKTQYPASSKVVGE